MSKRIYVVYYDSNTGANEDFNIFYMSPEVYLSRELAIKRIKFLQESGPTSWDTHMQEVDLFEEENRFLPHGAQQDLEEEI